MSNYSRIRLVVEKANNATFASSKAHIIDGTKTYDESMFEVEVDVPYTFTFASGPFSTVHCLIIENRGTVPGTTVTAAWSNKAANAQEQKIPIAGDGYHFLLVPDCDPAFDLTLTASAGAIPCKVTVLGT